MSHTAFSHLFPRIAENETRVITILSRAITGLPKGKYAFMEFYCTDSDCDCRNVYIHVNDLRTGKQLATISYGWESLEFYKDWMGGEDETLETFKGPALAPLNRQSKYADLLLAVFKETIETDQEYAARLVRHYHLVKDTIAV